MRPHITRAHTAVLVLVASGFVALLAVTTIGQSSEADGRSAAVTSWGDPDLQGLWNSPFEIALERPAKYGQREVLTEEERASLMAERGKLRTRDDRVFERGTEQDVAGGYPIAFTPRNPVGRFTSLIVDPPDGRMPPMTPEALRLGAIQNEFHLALLQASSPCKDKLPECAGGKYGPVSPRYEEIPPYYVAATIGIGGLNRAYAPEDMDLRSRCLSSPLPSYGGLMRIVQSRKSVAIFYEGPIGLNWSRVIPITDEPHLPSHVRLWGGDSRGRWEGDTLVVDVTNFDPRNIFPSTKPVGAAGGSGGTLHLIERFKRVDAATLAYSVTIDDPSTWTRTWTIRQEFIRRDDQKNEIFYEPRCHEGNYGLITILAGARVHDQEFAAGKGPHPATMCIATCGGDKCGF